MAVIIQLTQVQQTVIDDEFGDFAQLKWCAAFHPEYGNGGAYIALRTEQTKEGCKTHLLHRVIMERILGRKLKRSEQVDHEDLNPLNNRKHNLRLATPSQNVANRRKPRNNSSGYKGVTWYKRTSRWCAQICVNRKRINLGYYDTPGEAHEVYRKAADKLHREFKNYG
jgi:hypothetical protein